VTTPRHDGKPLVYPYVLGILMGLGGVVRGIVLLAHGRAGVAYLVLGAVLVVVDAWFLLTERGWRGAPAVKEGESDTSRVQPDGRRRIVVEWAVPVAAVGVAFGVAAVTGIGAWVFVVAAVVIAAFAFIVLPRMRAR
jgi:hypothetical protein